jgi:hypothetical protein
MDFELSEARELVSNEILWPKVRDYLARGGEFMRFPTGAKSRLQLVDDATRAQIDMWCDALKHADEWKSIVSGDEVRALKSKYPGVYPEVFRYTAYFSKFKVIDSANEEFLMLLSKLKFPEVYKLCSS